MFDQIKQLGALAGLMQNKDKLRDAAARFREKMERISVTGSAGGGAVRVTVSGKLRVTDVALDPALIAGLQTGEGGRIMAQSLIMDAVNDAITRAQAIVHEEADRQARELGLPGLPGIEGLMG
ncbi:MAG: YbaB/EbfC family nucleoid-associated protein [Planctomycetota bacterium]|nr:YbaB/EbfC family nucleoid-associated protein [Planctomycetota bacterium]